MKSLQESLVVTESLFDDDLVTTKDGLVQGWIKSFLGTVPYGNHKDEPVGEVDEKSKKITVKEYNQEMIVYTTDQAFYGFPTGYDFVDIHGKPINYIIFHGDIREIRNIPSSVNSISFTPNKSGTINSQVIKDINSELKRIKSLIFFSVNNRYSNGEKFKELDLSDLKINISNSLVISGLENGATVKFNTDLKTSILSFGYDSVGNRYNDMNINVESLPVFKTLTFKAGDFEHIKSMIEGIRDKGKSNFEKIIVSGGDLTGDQKEEIKALLKGQGTGMTGFGDLVKKLDKINAVINDKNGTRDRFGVDLFPGDLVIVCDSTNPSYPSIIDVYKGGTGGGRIKTERRSMVPPRNIIKINNPKILELIK